MNLTPIFIFDGPVSCSKLFGKVLNTHPQLQSINGYPYLLAATRGPGQIPAQLTPATQQRLFSKWQNEVKPEDLERWSLMTFEQSNKDVANGVREIQDSGKIPIVQEHAALCIKADISLECLRKSTDLKQYTQSNPTIISDNLIRSCRPLVLIRHPALYIPSFYRKQKQEAALDLDDEHFQLWISMKWVQILYEYFANDESFAPVVVDAEDVVHRTEILTSKLGSLFGIEPDRFSFSWQPESKPMPEGIMEAFHTRLRNSTGLERDDAKVLDGEIDLDEQEKAWVDEFGAEIAKELRNRVDAEMPIYHYLRDRRLKVA